MTCATVDPVIHSLDTYFKEKRGVEYIVFDETNPYSIEESKRNATRLGLDNLFEYQRHTGEVLFVDKNSKDILSVFAGVGSKEKYIDATEKLLNGEEVTSVEKGAKSYRLSKPPIEKIKAAKVYVIDIHHDKCGTCSVTAPVFEKVAEQYSNNPDISFFTFDLSTPKTIDKTRELAQVLGLTRIYDKYKHTGEVLFVDAKTKNIENSLIAETSVVRYHEIIDRLLNQKV